MLQLPIYSPSNDLMNFSGSGFIDSAISLSPAILWSLTGLVGLFFIIVSFVLSYHWKKYGFEKLVMTQASIIYFTVSFILLGIMSTSLAVYLSSI